MERGHERSNSPKTIKICLGKNLSMECKDNLDLNIIQKSHKVSMLGFFPAAKCSFLTLNNKIQHFCKIC